MKNNTIDYVEFGSTNLSVTKKFYSEVFWWEFKDFWETYTAFSNSGLKWGFELKESIKVWWILIVLYNECLEETKSKILEAGWKITIDIFSFPGWKRFEFSDPVWNVLAVWKEL